MTKAGSRNELLTFKDISEEFGIPLATVRTRYGARWWGSQENVKSEVRPGVWRSVVAIARWEIEQWHSEKAYRVKIADSNKCLYHACGRKGTHRAGRGFRFCKKHAENANQVLSRNGSGRKKTFDWKIGDI